MILIISETLEKSTDEVVEWLINFKVDFVRINYGEGVNILKKVIINDNRLDVTFSINNQTFHLSDIQSVWFRRGHLHIFSAVNLDTFGDNEFQRKLGKHLEREDKTLLDFIYQQLKTKKSLNHPSVYNMNKLIGLDMAMKAGLKIPNTLVTTNNNDLNSFNQKQKQIITKNIQDMLSAATAKYSAGQCTMLLTKYEVEETKDDFFYSLFQKSIPKKYELRVFYLDGECFTAAIFSQRDERTKVDYRHYDDLKMNRIIPYNLPQSEIHKIDTLMKSINMESGSIDIIVDNKDDYYFLEVNPVGQFDYVGKNCNYQLEQQIANFLIQN